MLTIQINDAEIHAMLQRVLARTDNMQPLMAAIGADIKTKMTDCFNNSTAPDGTPWKPLSPVTKFNRAKRLAGGKDKVYTQNGKRTRTPFFNAYSTAKPLLDRGTLRSSLTYNATNTSVEIGAKLKYAALQNFGGTKAQFPNLWGDVPARPFVPTTLPPAWQRDVMALITSYLNQP